MDLLPGHLHGISPSIHLFMMLQYPEFDLLRDILLRLQNMIAISGVHFHNGKLIICQFTRFIQDFIRDFGFSNIMQKSGDTDLIDLIIIQSIFSCYDHGHGSHIHAVLKGILITDLQGTDIHRHCIIILNSLQQIICDTPGRIGKVCRIRILIIIQPI